MTVDVGRLLFGEYDPPWPPLTPPVLEAAAAAAKTAAEAEEASRFMEAVEDEWATADAWPGGVNGLCGGSGWLGGWWVSIEWCWWLAAV